MKRPFLKTTLALSLALSMLLSGCGASSNKTESMVQMAPSAPAESPMAGGFGSFTEDAIIEESKATVTETTSSEPAADPLANKNIKLIWTANLNMETLDFDSMIDSMNQSIADFGGYIESSYVEGGERLNGRVNNRFR